MHDQMHNKIMAHQIMSILNASAAHAVLLCKADYTWKSTGDRNVEVSGLVLLAIIMTRTKPDYKVDMYTKIGNKKALKLHNYSYNVSSYFDVMKEMKLKIEEKDADAYTEKSFTHDNFQHLREAPV